jgi:2'-hydroxyisoflavone reductase
MKLLILGGTVFLGRHIVEAALARGHEVTLFNRGQHGGELFPGVEKLRGDREAGTEGLAALSGRHWDAVVDTSGYVPRVVGASVAALADVVEHYTFISSISVYADLSKPGTDETAPVGTVADESVEQVTGETYGPLKALCERAVVKALPARALVIRPGLIVGPHDPTDRFTYWPARIARGGVVLAPGRPAWVTQFIDVRDLAEWTLLMVEQRRDGTYNATGPETPLPFGQLVKASLDAAGSGAQIEWVGEQFLLDQGVQPWSDLPLWIPELDASAAGFNHVDCARALVAGLRFRPLAHTVRDTLAWHATRPAEYSLRAGLAAEREAELLRAWRQALRGGSS